MILIIIDIRQGINGAHVCPAICIVMDILPSFACPNEACSCYGGCIVGEEQILESRAYRIGISTHCWSW